MEHITVIDMPNGYKKLTPDQGYILKFMDNTYSEAIVKNTNGWSAVLINN